MTRPLEENFFTMDGEVSFDAKGFSQAKDKYIDYILQATQTYIESSIERDRKKLPLLDFKSFLIYKYKTKK